MNQHFSRVVHCSRRRERASIVEFLLSSTSATISAVNPLPPGYEKVMHRFAEEEDEVARIPAGAVNWGKFRCAHCGQRHLLLCSGCGSWYCDNKQENHIACPKCGSWASRRDIVPVKAVEASTYGTSGERPDVIRQKKIEAAERAANLLRDGSIRKLLK